VIEVRTDDLAFVTADAIARPVDAELRATTPLMRRLELAGGEKLTRHLRVNEPLAVGSAVVTSAGVAAIVGHIYPVWFGFRGGKGVAASAGVFAVLAPLATAVAALVFVVTIAATRFISAGSIAGALALPVAAAVANLPNPIVAGTLLAAAIVLVRHRDNLSRLLAGTERRIGLRL